MRSLLVVLALLFAVAAAPRLAAQDTSAEEGETGLEPSFDFDAAIAQASAAIDATPDDMNGYLRRGRLYFARGDYDHAIADFNLVLQNDPANAPALFQRARSYFRKNDLDQAIAGYTAFLTQRPDSAPACINLGLAYRLKGDLAHAFAYEDQALRLQPDSALAFFNRGLADKLRGDYDRAVSDDSQALKLDPTRPAIYVARGIAYGLQGNYALAAADYNAALKLDPNFAPACSHLAWQLATCPDSRDRDGKRAAAAALRACLLTGWMDAGLLDILAAACAEAGDFDDAVKWENKFFTYSIPEDLAKKARERLALYQNHQPYHANEEAPAPDGEAD